MTSCKVELEDIYHNPMRDCMQQGRPWPRQQLQGSAKDQTSLRRLRSSHLEQELWRGVSDAVQGQAGRLGAVQRAVSHLGDETAGVAGVGQPHAADPTSYQSKVRLLPGAAANDSQELRAS